MYCIAIHILCGNVNKNINNLTLNRIPMKIFLLALTLFSIHFGSSAQSGDTTAIALDSTKCYDEYKALFAKRGVTELKDGYYKTIVTFRLNGKCTAYEGKARIVGGKFEAPLYIKNENGEYVTIKSTGRSFNKNYDAYKIPLENKVVNGASPTYITNEDELADIFLVGLLKPIGK